MSSGMCGQGGAARSAARGRKGLQSRFKDSSDYGCLVTVRDEATLRRRSFAQSSDVCTNSLCCFRKGCLCCWCCWFAVETSVCLPRDRNSHTDVFISE